MAEMRKTDSYETPPGAATPEQAALNGKIAAANEGLQTLKDENQPFDEAKETVSELMQTLMKEKPIHRAKISEMQKNQANQ
jgi:hypothetical protein